MTRIRIAAAALAMALFAGACIGGAGTSGSFLVAAVTGAARLLTGNDEIPLEPGRRLAEGDTIQVADGGAVSLRRGDDGAVELRPARRAMAEVTIDAADRVMVGTGDLLVTSPESSPIAVASDGISARGEGVYRFDRSLSVRVGVYAGDAVVVSPQGTLELSAFRQGVIAGRVLPRESEPLRFLTTDPWDQRLLSTVIALDDELQTQRRGYQAEFGRRLRSTRPLRAIADGGPVRFTRPYLAEHTSGDLLIGWVITLLVEERDEVGRRRVFRDVMSQFDAGATWGLIAADRGLVPTELTDAVVRAIALRTGDVEPGSSVTGPSPTPTPTSGGSSPSPSPSPSRTRDPSPSPSPTESSSPSPSPSPTESGSPSPSPSECAIPVPQLCEDL